MQDKSPSRPPAKSPSEWLALLDEVAVAIKESLTTITDWSKPGDRPGQYGLDLVADAAALEVLRDCGAAVLSEEAGFVDETNTAPGEAVVIVDPVDGSTNASRRLPYYSTSLCVMYEGVFQVGLVVDLTAGTRWSAIAGEGAWCDGVKLGQSATAAGKADQETGQEAGQEIALAEALVVCNGVLPDTIKCGQTRTLGSAALDLCGTASGRFDAFIDPRRTLHVWDYAAGVLVCEEAGMFVAELGGDSLVHTQSDRLAGPLAAVNQRLGAELLTALR